MNLKMGVIPAILLSLSLTSCGLISNEWKRTESAKIRLYSRPDNFSKGVVHTESSIDGALQEQEYYIAEFEKKFNANFGGTVSIYLFNTDEINVKAGVGGGYSEPSSSTIYYRFFPNALNINGTIGPMGGHEIFHILAAKTFGMPNSRLLSEGGAVWFDGAYGRDGGKRKSVVMWMHEFNTAGALKKVSELTGDVAQIEEGTYYPQAGFVIKWIVERFGIEKYAELLKASAGRMGIETAVRNVYDMSVDELNSLGAKSSFKTFEEWSDSVYGKGKTQEFLTLVRKADEGILSSILGLSVEEIDVNYSDWVRKYLKTLA